MFERSKALLYVEDTVHFSGSEIKSTVGKNAGISLGGVGLQMLWFAHFKSSIVINWRRKIDSFPAMSEQKVLFRK